VIITGEGGGGRITWNIAIEDSGVGMNLYAAVLVYESSSAAAGYEPLYEETVTVFLATSEDHAAEKAREHGRSRQVTYENEDRETITWAFKHLVDVSEISDAVGDGAEIYTRHFRDYQAYCAFETLLPQRDSGERRSL
jgi:hypothetical protein